MTESSSPMKKKVTIPERTVTKITAAERSPCLPMATSPTHSDPKAVAADIKSGMVASRSAKKSGSHVPAPASATTMNTPNAAAKTKNRPTDHLPTLVSGTNP